MVVFKIESTDLEISVIGIFEDKISIKKFTDSNSENLAQIGKNLYITDLHLSVLQQKTELKLIEITLKDIKK